MGILGMARASHYVQHKIRSGQRQDGIQRIRHPYGATALAAQALVGDPDGSKARAASARSWHAEPKAASDKAWAYLEQTGRREHTARQARRMRKTIQREQARYLAERAARTANA